MPEAARLRRAMLFVGGLALESLPAALAGGADLVVIDLEDAVPPGRKDEAREAVLAVCSALAKPAGPQLVLRVNEVGTAAGNADVEAFSREGSPIGALMLPKVESPAAIAWVAGHSRSKAAAFELYPIIETAEGLEHCAAIALSDPSVKALVFGGFDLSAALGCEMAWEPLLYARSRVVHAAARAGAESIDSPYPVVDDLEGLRESCLRAKSLGMTGKAAKHAGQVATILEAFTPTRAEVERARRIMAAFDEDPTRPLVYEGRLVERPAIRRLARIASFDTQS
jgi:citrate lyase beta subunit